MIDWKASYVEAAEQHNLTLDELRLCKEQLAEYRNLIINKINEIKNYYIVWNQEKTEGFITDDEQLAYEVQKSAESNCYRKNGSESKVAKIFAKTFDKCITQKVIL